MSAGRHAQSPEAGDDTIEPVAFRASTGHTRRAPRRVPWLALAALLLLTALGVLAWFMFTAQSVALTFKPVPEQVTFNGPWPVVALGGRRLMRPGSYMVSARKSGYRPLQQTLEVSPAGQQQHTFKLQPLPGILAIKARPVDQARVNIDGESVGTTPLTGIELEAGKHSIAVHAERYQDYSKELHIQGRGKQQTLSVTLNPRWAAVTIRSNPAGAQVRIDDKSVGTTPVTADVLAGNHQVSLELAGYKIKQRDIEVVADKPQTLNEIRLAEADGYLRLASTPAGASVTVDGDFQGRTPLKLALAAGVTHEIRLSKAGYGRASRKLQIEPGQARDLKLALKARLGKVRIAAQPADARIYVDGQAKGEAGQTLSLSAVAHRIEIKKPGFEPYQTRVTPKPGFTQEVTAQLKTQAQAAAEARPATITSPAGQTLRLIQPKSFTMGASRREPGRRSNENLRAIKLTRPFYIGIHEVTNKAFRQYKSGHSSGIVQRVSLDQDGHPVVRVDWQAAAAYCNWLSDQASLPPAYKNKGGKLVAVQPLTTGYRLPTEAEWAQVARFAGKSALRYPWGDNPAPGPKAGNYADAAAGKLLGNTLNDYRDGYAATAPAGSFKANAAGLYDLGGNAAEWVNDYYAVYPGAANKTATEPTGPTSGRYHVIRGSSWQSATVSELRLAYRDYGDKPRPDLGFRIARYAK